jgi:enoyl-CoA hydratase/carnithine racemase
MTDVIVQLSEGVGELMLNRPSQRNSLTGPLVQELKDGLQSLLENEACNAIVVRGAEGYFCAGLDLKAFSADPAPDWRADFPDLWADYHRMVFAANIPIIGAVEGFAIAGGSSLALSCDFLVIGESAFMHVSEVERNMLAPLNVFWLTQRYGYQTALRMAVLGKRMTGSELVAGGMAELCVADTEVVAAAHAMATRFAGFDNSNLKGLKYSVKNGCDGATFDEALAKIKLAVAP